MTTIDTTGLRTRAQSTAKAGGDIHIAPGSFLALLDALDRAETERDEWRQTALDERGAVRDALEQVKEREARIKTVLDMCDDAEDPDQRPPRPVMHGGEPFPESLMVHDIRHALDGDA